MSLDLALASLEPEGKGKGCSSRYIILFYSKDVNMIEIKDLCKSFGKNIVLRELTLT